MLNIAIDGHVGSGKSSLAHALAEKLNLKVLDTGAIFRGIACGYKESNLGEVNDENINKFVKTLKINIVFENNIQKVLICDKDFTPFLRLEEISMLASIISPYPQIREKVLAVHRKFANENDCIIEGRDIGTSVLPNAQLKFFVTASEDERANRRYQQIKDKQEVSFEDILKDLRERDYRDEHRIISPLKPAKDAIILDTTNLTLKQTTEQCLKIISKLQD